MNKYLTLLTDKISNLYRAYEDNAFNSYMQGNNSRRLVVNFKTNNTIHFALFENHQSQEFGLVDEVYIGFDDERALYEAVALKIFIKALGNVIIYKLDNNGYYSPKHKPYVFVTVEDQKINNYVNQMIANQEIRLNTEIIDIINKRVKKKNNYRVDTS